MTAIPSRLLAARALTLRAPWAHAVADHGKNVENRTWMPPASVDTIIIHAGKGRDRTAGMVCEGCPEAPSSAFVAVADLAFACVSSLHLDEVACACGPWALPRSCHWRLANVRVLSKALPVERGRLGLWVPLIKDLVDIAAGLAVPHV